MGSGARFTSGGPGGGGFDDVFSHFGGAGTGTGGGGFEDIFSMFGQGAGGGRRAGFGMPTKGQDLRARTTLDFLRAANGDTLSLQSEDGTSFKIKVPAGVADGQKIRLRGRGRPSPNGGENGDIVVDVTVRPHPVFSRDGLNLRVTVPVTFTEATLGSTVEVPTLDGDAVKLKVAAGTPSGRVLRVKGEGHRVEEGHGRPARRGADRGPRPSHGGAARGARALPRRRGAREPPRRRLAPSSPRVRLTAARIAISGRSVAVHSTGDVPEMKN